MKAAILLFLLLFIVGIYLIFDFKSKEMLVSQVVHEKTNIEDSLSEKEEILPKKEVKEEPVVKNDLEKREISEVVKTDNICSMFGPINKNQKPILESIFNQNKISFTSNVTDIFSIFWNLGKQEKEAKIMFAQQKKGALENEKFQLVKKDNFWIVPIATIENNKEKAETLTKQLQEKANSINTGGTWELSSNSLLFYEVNKSNLLSKSQLEQIKILGVNNQNCH